MRFAGAMRFLAALTLALAPAFAARAAQDVANTVHNLSTSGPGTFKSGTIDRICVFCHTPHNATPSAPLWNHTLSGQTYLRYDSSTMQASPGQPTGSSRLCLACHDGTVALGALANLPAGQTNDLASSFLTGRANLGTDLTDDHPISFRYDGALQAQDPQLVPPAVIDLPLENGELQCTSCHDAHERDIQPFLRKTTADGQLCTTCHALGGPGWDWTTTSHATSPAGAAGGATPWDERKPAWRGATVAENACFNCHTPHNAATPKRLIKGVEEATCYLCHDGSVAAKNIQSDSLKPSRHPVDQFTGIHDPAEDFTGIGPSDHVTCADCHNSHAVEPGTATAPDIPPANRGVKGITTDGLQVAEASRLYEVCYKCHADNNVVSSPAIGRVILETNTRNEFDTGNPSFHPVEGPGANTNVPSLIPPLTENSVIYCTDCHASDTGPGAGGSGAAGPHGSIFSPLLERNYTTADNTSESSFAYALCYKCHDRNSILGDQSFKKHDKHIRKEKTPCSVCHDAHGISAAQGSSVNNSNLINFDLSVVQPNTKGEGPVFEDLGNFTGQCSLLCHNKNHVNQKY